MNIEHTDPWSGKVTFIMKKGITSMVLECSNVSIACGPDVNTLGFKTDKEASEFYIRIVSDLN